MEKMVEEWSDMEFTINLYGNVCFFLGHSNIVIPYKISRDIREYSFSLEIFDYHYL